MKVVFKIVQNVSDEQHFNASVRTRDSSRLEQEKKKSLTESGQTSHLTTERPFQSQSASPTSPRDCGGRLRSYIKSVFHFPADRLGKRARGGSEG